MSPALKAPSIRPEGAKGQRIAVFVPHFAEYATRLALGLAEVGVSVLLLIDARNFAQECHASLQAEARARLEVITFDSVGRSAKLMSLVTMLLALIRFRPHAILFQEQIDKLSAWVARTAGRLWPVVLTVHDPSPHSGNDAEYVRRNALSRRAIRAAAKGFHVHGAFCHAQLVAEVGTARPIVETAHGVILVSGDVGMVTRSSRDILMFGRMEEYKGLGVLLDAVDLLVQRGVEFRLVLAGRGPELDRFRPRIEAQPRIEVHERYLAPEDAKVLFLRCAVAVVPYLNATQSGVVAAAIGNGCPVVASRSGGLVDAVDEGCSGLLVPPGDAAALADALAHVLGDDALRQHLGAGATAAAQSKFAWVEIARELTAFISQRITERSASNMRE